MYNVKNARMSTFWTPSSFYIQLTEEDEFYNNLEAEMLAYYNGVAVYSYCCKLSGETPSPRPACAHHLSLVAVAAQGCFMAGGSRVSW